jgi:hypothetical protein
MPNYLDKLDPRANEGLRNSVKYLLHDYIVSSASELFVELFVATINLAIANGVSIGIDEMRAALKSGDPDYGKPSN